MVGTFAPDLEYFLRLRSGGGFGHTLPGAFLQSLPIALVTLWLFHRFVKVPLVELLPLGWQQRLQAYLGIFHFGGVRRFLLICASVLIGIATHILWDSFTHSEYWPYEHIAFLSATIALPPDRTYQSYQVLQYLSSVAGCLILAVWAWLWYRSATPSQQPDHAVIPASRRIWIVVRICLISILCGLTAAAISVLSAGPWDISRSHTADAVVVTAAVAVVTAGALVWWQLVIYGAFRLYRMRAETDAPSCSTED